MPESEDAKSPYAKQIFIKDETCIPVYELQLDSEAKEVEMEYWRRSLRVTRKDKIRNEVVRDVMDKNKMVRYSA